jgi:isopentenyldiphosphate isomerase
MANVTLVNENDEVIDAGSKTTAISGNIIHRISRIFVFNSKGELLIQKRAPNVDVPNRWDQSAAGHVDEGEDYLTAATRELGEEVGITNVPLKQIVKFYSEETDDSRVRKRFNMLFSAKYDGEITVDPGEVSDTRWVQPEELEAWMEAKPEEFTLGFVKSYQEYMANS